MISLMSRLKRIADYSIGTFVEDPRTVGEYNTTKKAVMLGYDIARTIRPVEDSERAQRDRDSFEFGTSLGWALTHLARYLLSRRNYAQTR